ncbi:MAG: tyrosine--tRNA ligase, partial [Alphaproteobacteria bacterium]
LTMESVKQRLDRDQPLSFLEFNYMLLQAYDFLELRRRHGVVLQMGGSDQWGNIVMGMDLIRRMDQAETFGLTTPLMITASGLKMGKTAQGAVWLNADRVSPYDYWQFWRNTEDADLARFMGLFTELPMTEVARYTALQGAEVNEAKKVLATEACALLHGRHAAEAAAETARKAFEEGLNAASLPTIVSALPANIVDVLVEHKLVPSKGEARRLIANGGIYANNEAVGAVDRVLGTADVQDGVIKISIGKKRHVLLKPA